MHGGCVGARGVCRPPWRQAAARGVLRHAAAPRCGGERARRAAAARRTGGVGARTGVGTRARAFLAGGGAHSGKRCCAVLSAVAPRARGAIRGRSGRLAPPKLFRCARSAGAPRGRHNAPRARRGVEVLRELGRCVARSFVLESGGVFMPRQSVSVFFRRGEVEGAARNTPPQSEPQPSRTPRKLPLAPTSTKSVLDAPARPPPRAGPTSTRPPRRHRNKKIKHFDLTPRPLRRRGPCTPPPPRPSGPTS